MTEKNQSFIHALEVEFNGEPEHKKPVIIQLKPSQEKGPTLVAVPAVASVESMAEHVRKCEVCNQNPVHGVYSSSVGPISFGYCEECAKKGAEPYGALVAYIASAHGLDEWKQADVQEHFSSTQLVQSTLQVAGKTFPEFVEAVTLSISKTDQEMERWYNEQKYLTMAEEDPATVFLRKDIENTFNLEVDPDYVLPMREQLGDDKILFFDGFMNHLIFTVVDADHLTFFNHAHFKH